METSTWDNEEIDLTNNGAHVYAFSRSEFESEHGMSPEAYNVEQEKLKSTWRTVIHTWKTTIDSY